jgi:hypothetical protein
MYEEVRHPFDPHPVGIHRTPGSSIDTQQDTSKGTQPVSQQPQQKQQNSASTKADGSEKKSAPESKPKAPAAVVQKQDAAAGGSKGKEEDGLTQLDRDYKPTRWIPKQSC